jgi:hypothetical protein
MGGIGKSVLACVLAHDRQVRHAFPDGVFWLSFGQQPDIVQLQRNAAVALGGDGLFEHEAVGKTKLRELLLTRAALLVCDDVWDARHTDAFDVLGPRCRALLTTRDAGLLHSLRAAEYRVELLSDTDALMLLAKTSGADYARLPAAAREVARECNHLPLALALCGGMAYGPDGIGWSGILEALQSAELEEIATDNPLEAQHASLWRAITLSVHRLTLDEQRRFAELAVFPEDKTVPEAAVRTLWSHTGGMKSLGIEKLLKRLAERSLVYLDTDRVDPAKPVRRVSLHDLLHDYAVRMAGEPRAVHQKLLDAYRKKCLDGWHTGPNDGYYFESICHHLLELENWEDLLGDAETRGPLSDLLFIQAKCEAGLVHELVGDYNQALAALPEFRDEMERIRRRDEEVGRYHRELNAYACRRWEYLERRARNETLEEPRRPAMPATLEAEVPEELPEQRSQRAARLRYFANFVSGHIGQLAAYPDQTLSLAVNDAEDSPVSAQAEGELAAFDRPWLQRSPRPPAPPPRPQCLRTLQGHSEDVWSVSVCPDARRAVSASWDKTLRVWDLDTGQCLRTLQGHSEGVNSVSVCPDGRRAVSASDDKTLRVWDLDTGQCVAVYHAGSAVVSVVITPSGDRIVCGTAEGQIHFLIPRNFPPSGPILVTAANHRQARCPACGQEFAPPSGVVTAIRDGDAAGLFSQCP